ncbi:MAG: MBOAT family O-acyltransferase [Candidatus Zixiibacteriota bacterium]
MSFASSVFAVFLIGVFLVYWYLPNRPQVWLLLSANCLFYAYWDWRFLALLFSLAAVNYVCGSQIDQADRPVRRRAWLLVSLIVSVGVLGYFKYYNFFVESFAAMLASAGFTVSSVTRHIILPLGLSYYTFQMLTYTLDIYRGQIKPTGSSLHFAVFAGFFGHIVAGPITRARQFLPQFRKERQPTPADLEVGLRRILLGLFKKLFIADTLALYLVDPVFAAPESYSAGLHWLAMAGYAVQIYADFSGYSSMAVGVARLLGLKLPENFNFPYLAVNIAEFWRRWHITLSRWLRDYIWWALAKNIPFSGGWKIRLRSHFSLFVVFVICGLWHGASWTFVAWGALHGIYIVTYEIWHRSRAAVETKKSDNSWFSFGIVAAWLITQAALLVSWVLFRSNSFDAFASYLTGLFSGSGVKQLQLPMMVWGAFFAFAVDHIAGWLLEHRPTVKASVPAITAAVAYVALILFLFNARPGQTSQFIYFQF